jgi:pimeloyl-ACP methyl ester carboxylesterase
MIGRMLRRRPTAREWPRKVPLGDVSLYVDVVGRGDPLVLMHGGPSADLWTMGGFRECADQHTLVFYYHRCNGRSVGVPVSTMTMQNLTVDADALREYLGFEKWAVLGHSFGGHVALECALRYPNRVSHWCSSTPAQTAGGPGRMLQQSSPSAVTALPRWNSSAAGSTASSHHGSTSRYSGGSATRTSTAQDCASWRG